MQTRLVGTVAIVTALALGLAAGASHDFAQGQPLKPEPPAPPGPATPGAAPKAAEAETGGGPDEIRRLLESQAATTEEHRLLDALVGTFKAENQMFTERDKPLSSHGTARAEWILGKRFVKVETKAGEAAEKELALESLSIYGYDTRTKKYTVVAFDTLGTYWVSAEGDFDKATNELRLAGSVLEGGEKLRFRWIVKLNERGNTTSVMINAGTGGEQNWTKASELVQARE